MLATSHLFWSAAARPSATRWWLLSAVAPDLPAIARAASLLRARGRPLDDVCAATYHRSPWREVQLTAHSVYGPLALVALTRRRAARQLAAGWLGHLAIDALTHHDDAWPLLWPLSRRRWRSPLSYWQREHHARLLLVAELIAVTLAARRTRYPALGLLAAAATGYVLRGTLADDRGPMGPTADPLARERDLAGLGHEPLDAPRDGVPRTRAATLRRTAPRPPPARRRPPGCRPHVRNGSPVTGMTGTSSAGSVSPGAAPGSKPAAR